MSPVAGVEGAAAALIVAAGRGLRAGGTVCKQYRDLAGRTVLTRSLEPFLAVAGLDLLVVIAEDARAAYHEAVAECPSERLRPPAVGGATRQDSVRAGLEALAASGFAGLVLIHDAARPFASQALVERAVAAARKSGAAIPVLPVTDTIKQLGEDGIVVGTPPRASLAAVQTPQAFAFAPLLAAHRAARAAGLDGFTDDAALMEWAGHAVSTFPGESVNVKLTHPEDFVIAANRLSPPMRYAVGTGYDVHAFAPGDTVWLGGVAIAHECGVQAHSDGDVALHALTDAVLGALAEGDIGTHFPPSDPAWRGASSDRFLAFAVERVRQRGGIVDHLDLTVICEAPKVGPHREAIRSRIAAISGIELRQIAIKATTSERLGFTGRREGLAALATATLRLPIGE